MRRRWGCTELVVWPVDPSVREPASPASRRQAEPQAELRRLLEPFTANHPKESFRCP